MSDTYAVVENGVVTNIIIWDGVGGWSPDSGKAVKVKKECGIGWGYDGKSFTPIMNESPVKSTVTDIN